MKNKKSQKKMFGLEMLRCVTIGGDAAADYLLETGRLDSIVHRKPFRPKFTEKNMSWSNLSA
jgi:hypothetical protein